MDANLTFVSISTFAPMRTSTRATYKTLTPTATKISEITSIQATKTKALVMTETPTRPPYMKPDDFIRSYYQEINDRNYGLTFSWLSSDFKDRNHCCNADGSYKIEPYIEWWKTIERVDVISTEVVNWDDQTAQVNVKLCYYTINGVTDIDNNVIFLMLDEDSNTWLIERVELR